MRSCVGSPGASPPAVKQQPTSVFAPCSDGQCVERQRGLVECLIYEEVAAKGLHEQVATDARALSVQMCAAEEARERSTAQLFSVANRLNAAFGEYHEAVAACDAASRALAVQRDCVREGQICVDHIRDQLAETKARVASVQRLVQSDSASQEFDVYATGCRPDEQQHPAADCCDEPVLPACLLNPKG